MQRDANLTVSNAAPEQASAGFTIGEPPPDWQPDIANLARLPRIEYDQRKPSVKAVL